MADAEHNYAVIEKEALAATWACERFSDYVLGLDFTIETDHKPLVPLLNTTELHKMPPRIQRFRLRLMRYQASVIHVAGKDQTTADALSRAPATKPSSEDITFINDEATHVQQCIETLPASTRKLQIIREAQNADAELHQVRTYCKNGWPDYMPETPLLEQYWTQQAALDDH
eukprot:TRINITY_DN39521_c0_g1_i4.p2 TRINITY_DN39521_c0_g1~~TRINITY_DN39521_c0_g1_i4.p2  ORF type:complete len:172 (-),score=43.26 TRINITY_DN39521_c0_g1_i4:713-1228(-)